MIVTATILGLATICGALYFKYPWIMNDLVYMTAFRQMVQKVKNSIISKTWVIDHFEATAARLPSKHFIVYEDQGYSYAFMNQQANKVAHLALDLGWKEGDVIALNIANEPALLWTWLGLAKCGITSCLLNTNLRHKSLKHCLNVSEAKALIIGQDEELQKAIEEVGTELPVYAQGQRSHDLPSTWLSFDDRLDKASDAQPDRSIRSSITARSALFYVFTSGTTGLPKAAIVSQDKGLKHGNMLCFGGLIEDDTVYTPLPLYHVAALAVTQSTILTGCTLVIRKKFSVTHFWEDCRKHNVTHIHYIGEMCRYLLSPPKSDCDRKHKVRLAFGNGLRADIWREFQERFGIAAIMEVYASTDGNIVFMNIFNKVGSCGYFSPMMRKMMNPPRLLKCDLDTGKPIRDDNGFCVEVEQGKPGLLTAEINMTSPFDGYVGKKELTESKILRGVFKEGDAYLNTGDLLYFDKDHFLYFSDRTGDTFRWKGENVSTTEVSNALCELPWIEDANVYGVPIPGCEGKCGMATLTLKTEHQLTTEKLKELFTHCNAYLVGYAQPRFIRIQPKMEMTSTLKQLKISLVKDGFDPAACGGDALYFLDTEKRTYSTLTADVYGSIVIGKSKL